MNAPLRALIIEDNECDAELLVSHLESKSLDLSWTRVQTPEEFSNALYKKNWDVILADYSLPHFGIFPALKILKDLKLDIPFIVVSGTVSEEIAVEAMRAGAHDFCSKGKLTRLVPAVEREMREVRIRRERRNAREQVKISEARYRSLIEASNAMVWTASPSGEVIFADPRWEEFSSHRGAEITDLSWLGSVHPEDKDSAQQTWTNGFAQKKRFENLARFRRNDGSYRHLFFRVVPIFSSDGVLKEWVGAATDISDRKLSEEAVRLSEERYRDLFENAHDLVYTHDMEGRFTSVNLACELVTGYMREELMLMRWQEIVVKEMVPVVEKKLRQRLTGQVPEILEVDVVRRDGRRIPLELSARVVFYKGEPVGIQGVARDISDRISAESELRRMNRALTLHNEANQAIVRSANEAQFLERICRIVVDTASYRLAWIGFAGQDESKSIVPVAQAGFEDGYLSALQLTWNDTERGRGPTGKSIRLRTPVVVRDIQSNPDFAPWRTAALQNGYASVLALPLAYEGHVYGALTIYACEFDAFDDAEIKLLLGMAGDLAFGIRTFRMREEHSKAEKQVQLQASALSAAANAIVITDLRGDILWVNPAFTSLTGYASGEVIGGNPRRLKSGKHTPEFYKQLWDTVKSGHVWTGEVVNKKKDGTLYTEDMTITPVRNERGEIANFVAIKQDITEWKRTAEKIQEQTERFQQLADSIQEGFWIRQLNPSRLLYINPGFEKIIGRPCPDISKAQNILLEAVVPEHRQRVLEILEVHQAELEFEIQWPDGTRRWIWARKFPIRNKAGEVYRTAGIALDVTERKQALATIQRAKEELEERVATRTEELQTVNQQLEIRNREVEEATQHKSEFLASMSHELRTPLNAIIGFSDLLAECQEVKDDTKLTRYLGHVQKASRHLLQLINDVLDLTKVEAGKLELQPEEISLDVLINEVMATINPLAAQKCLELTRNILPGLQLVTDYTRFKQVLFNLFSNAVKFTPEGGSIGIEAGEEGEFVAISVIDSGIGIAPENLDKVFEEFKQLSIGTSGAKQGTGLGLTISRRLVEQQGGTIEVQSELGKGSRFTVRMKRFGSLPSDNSISENCVHEVQG